jgi:vacuolar protein sorting-associated protein 13A/C
MKKINCNKAMIFCESLFCSSVINNCLLVDVQVVHFQPHTLFINRFGCSLCLQQCDSQSVAWIHPSDSPKPFGWQSSAKVELLKVCSIESFYMIDTFSVTYGGVSFFIRCG